ncbi:hypothetical protein [Desulfosporosinus acidiphilus]|uniref:hypothetical protein n=1 Tax=Desulfosporosinus acidiphilus TaxID=885581 RepID=UPI0013050D82|nr:hypothetical protein [Desulfosporosinus acidiphilus]
MQKTITSGNVSTITNAMNTPEIEAIMGERHVNQMAIQKVELYNGSYPTFYSQNGCSPTKNGNEKPRNRLRGLPFQWSRWSESNRRPAHYE